MAYVYSGAAEVGADCAVAERAGWGGGDPMAVFTLVVMRGKWGFGVGISNLGTTCVSVRGVGCEGRSSGGY